MMAFFRFAGFHIVSGEWGDGDDDFVIHGRCLLRLVDKPLHDAFQVTVVSPRYLAWLVTEGEEELVLARGMLITAHFERSKIEEYLIHFLSHSKATTWDELRQFVSQYFYWIDELI